MRRRTLLGAVCFLAVAPVAQAQYVQRQVVTTNGAVTFIGNSLGLNKAANPTDGPGTSGAVGAFITTNTALRKNASWPLGTTSDWKLNSSTAILNLPAGSTVIYAELIWGGSWAYGGENVSAFLNGAVNLTTPAGTSSVAPDPATVKTGGTAASGGAGACNSSLPCFYTRTSNVTGLIQSGGNGTYTVGRVPGTQGVSEDNLNAAGWTLAILYQNFSLPTRNLSVFVGLEAQGAAAASVSGFCTTDSATQRGRVAVSAVEGDTQLTGDTMRFGPDSATLSQNGFRLWGSNNPITNFFASQINGDDGLLNTGGTFGSRNNSFSGTLFAGGRQGWDITNVDASAQLTRGQTVAFAQGTSSGDNYSINALGLQIDVGAPRFAFDGATTVNRGTAVLGDTLTVHRTPG